MTAIVVVRVVQNGLVLRSIVLLSLATTPGLSLTIGERSKQTSVYSL
jgi:hypothetical protein